MQIITKYLNGLTKKDRHDFIRRCGTSEGYLRKAASIKQTLGEKLCVRIEQETNGEITRKDLRPDDWHLIWPELKESAHA